MEISNVSSPSGGVAAISLIILLRPRRRRYYRDGGLSDPQRSMYLDTRGKMFVLWNGKLRPLLSKPKGPNSWFFQERNHNVARGNLCKVELQLAKLRKLSSITKMDSRGYNSTYETLREYSLYRAKV
ncbi:unnamed protein product [Arabidopsis thaliana]|uniref:Uncharacterized protein n=1 Tax=Arabidopsis thaliana TaxID=3702 RepID=A0A5S9S6J4_ARATH|nr:unnamed protein product [Arabidopsis thaliana]